MQITHFEQDNMRYEFEPPIDVGSLPEPRTIHELAAIALVGPEATDEQIVAGMHDFTAVLQSDDISRNRILAFTTFLEGKHTVTGTQTEAGMPIWRSGTPNRGKVPDAELGTTQRQQLSRDLFELSCAEAGVLMPVWVDQVMPS